MKPQLKLYGQIKKKKKITSETKNKFISGYTQEICNNFTTTYL